MRGLPCCHGYRFNSNILWAVSVIVSLLWGVSKLLALPIVLWFPNVPRCDPGLSLTRRDAPELPTSCAPPVRPDSAFEFPYGSPPRGSRVPPVRPDVEPDPP